MTARSGVTPEERRLLQAAVREAGSLMRAARAAAHTPRLLGAPHRDLARAVADLESALEVLAEARVVTREDVAAARAERTTKIRPYPAGRRR